MMTRLSHRPRVDRHSGIRPVRNSTVQMIVRTPSGQVLFIRSKFKGA